jgi:RimJ/RimL family protein N-acetyltransferase
MEPKYFIETPRLILRQWKIADHEPFILMNQDEDVMAFYPSVLTKDETLAQVDRIAAGIEKNGFGFFAAERKDNGRFIGYIGLSQPRFQSFFTPCTEIGWRLSRESWGHGFATEGAKACLQFGFNELALDEIYSFTTVFNTRSERVMQRIGMIKQGYFERPHLEQWPGLQQHVLYRVSKNQF